MKYKNHCEYSFQVWIKSVKQDYEPKGEDYFMKFIKTVLRFNAKSWYNLEERIIDEIPDIERDFLEMKLDEFNVCQKFYKAHAYPAGYVITNEEIPLGHYKLRSFRRGEFTEEIRKI